MTAKIKVLHSKKKVSKKGKPYTKVMVLIEIGDNEFVETYYVY